MERRIYGIETEFGVTATSAGERRLTPDEVARTLFRPVVAWGRSSNVFLTNGSRLYLDVGAHPEYATAECDNLLDVIAHDKAGERILGDMRHDAQERLIADGVDGTIYVFKNNTDSAGNSYGCHENFLIERSTDVAALAQVLVPFLITRQLVSGAGKILGDTRSARFNLTQRAEHIWDGYSSATTRSRPIINSRDEAHADSALYRRLHVIVGDSTLAQPTTLLKVGSAHLVLRMIEAGIDFGEVKFANDIKAIRGVSEDMTGQVPLQLADGRTMTPLAMQRLFFERASAFYATHGDPDPAIPDVLDLWGRALDAIEGQNLAAIDTEIDWAIKYRLLQEYAERNNLEFTDPRMAQLDLAFHDLAAGRGLFSLLERAGRVRTLVDSPVIDAAKTIPPSSTRAQIRGRFVEAASKAKRDYTVDWVHLKLNDQAGRTIMCRDPFAAHDERVDALIETISAQVHH